jgi:hypothetical protein
MQFGRHFAEILKTFLSAVPLTKNDAMGMIKEIKISNYWKVIEASSR